MNRTGLSVSVIHSTEFGCGNRGASAAPGPTLCEFPDSSHTKSVNLETDVSSPLRREGVLSWEGSARS